MAKKSGLKLKIKVYPYQISTIEKIDTPIVQRAFQIHLCNFLFNRRFLLKLYFKPDCYHKQLLNPILCVWLETLLADVICIFFSLLPLLCFTEEGGTFIKINSDSFPFPRASRVSCLLTPSSTILNTVVEPRVQESQ